MREAGYSVDDDEEPTKQELYEQAQELDISDRSTMNKEELAQAVAKASDSQDDKLAEQTRDELYKQAQKLDISGRSTMNKDELIKAIRDAQ